MIFLNIEGLYRGKDKWKKINFLREISIDEEPILIILTETHLCDNIDDKEIDIPGYSIYRSDRINRIQGGVMIYIRKPLLIDETVLTKFSNGTCETLIVKIKDVDIHVVCVYRPRTLHHQSSMNV